MGMFDTVMVPCPTCGEKADFQSKSGPCVLGTHELEVAPADVLSDVNRHAPHECVKCGTRFLVSFLGARAVSVVEGAESPE